MYLERLAQGVYELFLWAPMAIAIVAIALTIVYLSQRVRNSDWFDRNGAAQEMGTIRDRVGTEDEAEGDNIACGLQYLGTTLFVAIVALSFFIVQSG